MHDAKWDNRRPRPCHIGKWQILLMKIIDNDRWRDWSHSQPGDSPEWMLGFDHDWLCPEYIDKYLYIARGSVKLILDIEWYQDYLGDVRLYHFNIFRLLKPLKPENKAN